MASNSNNATVRHRAILSGLKIDILEAGHNTFGKQWQLTGRNRYPFTRLYCFERGRATMELDDTRLSMRRGFLYLVPASREVDWMNDGGFTTYWCLFHATVLEGLDLLNILDLPVETKLEDVPLVLDYFRRLVAACKSNDCKNTLHTEALLKLLIAPCIDAMEPGKAASSETDLLRLRPVVTYVLQNLEHAITVSELASIVSLESKHFSKLFKRTLGVAPYTFVTQQRVRRVQHLLLETADSLDQLAEQTGFSDAFHLSKTFRKITGITPSGFRARRYDIIE